MSLDVRSADKVGKEALDQISRFKQYGFLVVSTLAALFTGNKMLQKTPQYPQHTMITYHSNDKPLLPVSGDSVSAQGKKTIVKRQPSFPSTTIPNTVYSYNQYVADTTIKPTTNVVGLEEICDDLICPNSSVVPQGDDTGLNTVAQPDTTSLRPIL